MRRTDRYICLVKDGRRDLTFAAITTICSFGPSSKAGHILFGFAMTPFKPARPYPPHLASRARRQTALSDSLGRCKWPRERGPRPSARYRGPATATSSAAMAAPTRSTAPWRFPPARSIRSGRPDLTNTHPAETIGPLRAMERSAPHRVAGSLGPSRRRQLQGRNRRRHRHPPEHRRHQGAARSARDAGRDPRRTAEGRQRSGARPTAASASSRSPSIRSGICPASPSASTRRRTKPATFAVRTDRRHVSRIGDAAGLAGVPAADRRHHGLSVRRRRQAQRPVDQDHLPRARRVQRLGRVSAPISAPAGPYLIHGIEECARGAQEGGLGIIVYNRKEGRALGEVTKFLVYNARKRQEGGDAASAYFRAHRMRRRRAGRAASSN